MARTMNDDPEPRLGERELDIMQALWQLEHPATVTEVHGALVDGGHDLAYTTVQTMLNRLEAKGKVRRERRGRAHRYRAATAQKTLADAAITRLLSRFFSGSPEALATHLVGNLRDDELKRVQELIDGARAELES